MVLKPSIGKTSDKLIRFVLYVMMIFLCMPLYAQNIQVEGIVKDIKGEPIIGASIFTKENKSVGTITALDGTFSLFVPGSSTLVISYIGYASREVKVNDQTFFNIELQENTTTLDEVVAIGYGVVRKKDLTGAVTAVGGDKIADRKAMRVSQSLQGAISGVNVSRTGSDPSLSATIRVRGITTISDSSPLVLIDGIPGTLDWVSPEDVENISVLKDAASASIYGSRAAAGVILVTTKRGKSGAIDVQYNYEIAYNKPQRVAKFADVKTYMRMMNERAWNDAGNVGDEDSFYKEDVINNYDQLHAEDPNTYPDTDWIGLMLKNHSFTLSHKLNMTAGSEKIKTKIAFQYDNENGLYMHKGYERYLIRANNDLKFNSWLDASVDMNGIYSNTRSPQGGADGLLTPLRPAFSRVYNALWSDGRIANGNGGKNPYGILRDGGGSKNRSQAIGGKAALNIRPLKDLVITATFSPQIYYSRNRTFITKVPYTYANAPDAIAGYLTGASTTSLTELRPYNYSLTAQLYANYNRQWRKHSLSAMVGYENYYYYNESLSASRDRYELDTYPYLDLGNADYQYSNSSAYENAYRSYFGRIMYNWNNRYFLQINGRYDGSSRFASGNRWGFFPSISAGWIISDELFLKDKVDWLSSLKLRASWGQLGNERIGNYPYQSTVSFDSTLLYQGSTIVTAQSAGIYDYAIHDISWETTETVDLGLDSYLFNNRMKISFDWYKKLTKDMLLALKIPYYVGLNDPEQNTGKMHTTGWDLEFSWNDQIAKWRYSATFNISDYKSKMGDLGGTEFLGDKIKREGSEFNEWYGYLSDGIYQTEDGVSNSAVLNKNVKPGDIKYVDISGPDGVPDRKISADYDRVLLGGSLPRFLYGGTFNVQYKNIDFGLMIQGIGKYNLRKSGDYVRPFVAEFWDVPAFLPEHYWSKYNTDEYNMKAEYPRLSQIGNVNNYAMSDYWLFNGWYMRVKNISLGYNIPEQLLSKIHVRGLRFYANVIDPFSIDDYPKYWAPDGESYWVNTSYLLGISVKF